MEFLVIIGLIILILFVVISNTTSNDSIKIENKPEIVQQKTEILSEPKIKTQDAPSIEIKSTTSQPNLKSNWQEYEKILKQYCVTKLYHFTDKANLESIKNNGGLFSWFYCEQNKIIIPKPGGSLTSRDLDTRKNLYNYVHLSFVREHPMMFVAMRDGRLTDPVILEIDPKVIYFEETKFTAENAVKNGVVADSSLETFQSIKFHIFGYKYFDVFENYKPYYQAEALVLEKIPLNLITNTTSF